MIMWTASGRLSRSRCSQMPEKLADLAHVVEAKVSADNCYRPHPGQRLHHFASRHGHERGVFVRAELDIMFEAVV